MFVYVCVCVCVCVCGWVDHRCFRSRRPLPLWRASTHGYLVGTEQPGLPDRKPFSSHSSARPLARLSARAFVLPPARPPARPSVRLLAHPHPPARSPTARCGATTSPPAAQKNYQSNVIPGRTFSQRDAERFQFIEMFSPARRRTAHAPSRLE